MRLNPNTEANLRNLGLLLLRVAAGGMMLVKHGIPKIERFGQDPIRFSDPLGVGVLASLSLAVFAEVVCSSAVILGLLTRLAAVPLVATMLVAAFIVHADDPWNKKEFALMFALPFLTLVFTGPGAWSVDSRIFKGR